MTALGGQPTCCITPGRGWSRHTPHVPPAATGALQRPADVGCPQSSRTHTLTALAELELVALRLELGVRLADALCTGSVVGGSENDTW